MIIVMVLVYNNDAEGHAVCEQDDQHLRYEMSHANSRPAGEDVDVERGTDVESGDETGSDEDDGEVVFNRPIPSTSVEMQLQADRERSNVTQNTGFGGVRTNDVASVQKLLPFMHDTTELLGFFNGFKRALEMHNVQRECRGENYFLLN